MMQHVLDELRELLGNEGVLSDAARIAPLLVDERGLYQGRAAAVLQPRSVAELVNCVQLCIAAGIPIVPQGGNTGYCGGATPDESGREVLINLARLNRSCQVDESAATMTVEAGVILADAQRQAKASNLYLPLSMGSEGSCQIGGVISTNAGGVAVLRYGTARDLVAGLEVVLPDGRIWSDLKGLRKDNTGYDLKQLFIGAEGSLGVISKAILRLSPLPRTRLCAWVGVRDIGEAVATLASLRSRLGDCINSFEYISKAALKLVLDTIEHTRDPLGGAETDHALIEVVSFSSDALFSREFESALVDCVVGEEIVIAQSDRERTALWRLRESIPEAEKRHGGSVKHDISVALGALGDFANEAAALTSKNFPGSRLSIYGHVGDGNLHINVLAPVGAAADAYRSTHAEAISARVHRLAIARNGSFSAEHGIGKFKRKLLAETADPVELDLMRRMKSALDPLGLMNPGKVL